MYSPDAQQHQQRQWPCVTAQHAQCGPDGLLFEHSSGQHAHEGCSYSPRAQHAQQQQHKESEVQQQGLADYQAGRQYQRHGPAHSEQGQAVAAWPGGLGQQCNKPCRQALPLALPKQQPSDMYHDEPLPASAASAGEYQRSEDTAAPQQALLSVIQWSSETACIAQLLG